MTSKIARLFGSGGRAAYLAALNYASNLSAINPSFPVMAAPPTVTAGASQTLPREFYVGSHHASYKTYSHAVGGSLTVSGTGNGSGGYGLDQPDTVTNRYEATEPDATSSALVSFIHDGTEFEIELTSETGGFAVRVDGEFVDLTPRSKGSDRFFKYDFGSRKARRIDIYGKMSLIGVFAGETDVVLPAPKRGPRVVIVGDSFTTSAADGWPIWFSALMGWDDVWVSGVGGTGYLTDGSGTKSNFTSRVSQDVIALEPDVVITAGSINDAGQSYDDLYEAVSLYVAKIQRELPDSLVIGGYNARGGIEWMNATALAAMDAVRDAYVSNDAVWLNPIELPISFTESQGNWTTVRSAASAGRLGSQGVHVNSSTTGRSNIRIGSTVEIGEGATRERFVVTGTGVQSGTLLLQFDGALQYAHPVDTVIREVGPSYITGKGNEGAATGVGNSDVLVSSGGIHPNVAGAQAYALVWAQLVTGYLHNLL